MTLGAVLGDFIPLCPHLVRRRHWKHRECHARFSMWEVNKTTRLHHSHMQNMQDSYLNVSFCNLIFTDSPYRELICVITYFWLIHPKFDKFCDIPRYTVNSVFMTGFHDSIHVFHIAETAHAEVAFKPSNFLPHHQLENYMKSKWETVLPNKIPIRMGYFQTLSVKLRWVIIPALFLIWTHTFVS